MFPYPKSELERPKKVTLRLFPLEFELILDENLRLERLSFGLNLDPLGKEAHFEDKRLSHLLEVFLQGLKDYFSGKASFLEFPHLLKVRPPSQRVLSLLREIPRGKTITYGELAKRTKLSPRAIGQILAKNPLPLLYPCHRVISRQGLGGFSQGPLLKWLLLYWEGPAKNLDRVKSQIFDKS